MRLDIRRFSNLKWFTILLAGAAIVFFTGALSLHIKFNLPALLPENVNDSPGTWAFGAFWIIHAPLIFILCRRISFERRDFIKSLLIYLPAAMLWALLVQGLPLLLLPFLSEPVNYGGRRFYDEIMIWFGANFLPNALIFWLVVPLGLLSSHYERYQNEKLKTSLLDAQLSTARLQALQMQLHPHFLFNTLHSISALVLADEARDAVKMINRLSELLRLTLDRSDVQIVTLEDEIEFTRRYLEIERIRFQDRLTVEINIDSQTTKARVPTLILQPLVENAMRHGVDSRSEKSRIKIAARLQNDRVVIEVCDDGKDLNKLFGQAQASGLGIKNTRARLAEIYGQDCAFSLSRTENFWTTAQINIPFSPARKYINGEPK